MMPAMRIYRRFDHTTRLLYIRTISAQLHLLGCVLALLGAAVLLPRAYAVSFADLAACAAFVVTGFFVFLASAVYHFISDGFEASPRLNLLLDNLDHYGIYLFIAGTYTPFLLHTVAPPWRAPLLVAVWLTAILGITFTSLKPWLPKMLQHRAFYTGIFLAMGWAMVIRITEILRGMSLQQTALLVSGGLAYTVGAAIYGTKWPRLFVGVFGYHEVWHVLVLVGATCHYFLVLSFYS